MRRLTGLLPHRYTRALAYMLQDTEYSVYKYFRWLIKTPDFSSVMNRRELKRTKASLAIITYLTLTYLVLLGLSTFFLLQVNLLLGVIALISTPAVCALSIIPPVFIGGVFRYHVGERIRDRKTEEIFRNHPALKIAVLGSYGKTTVKELLAEVLGSHYEIASSPGNMNTAVAHYRLAKSLKGDEKFIILEYGEEIPGDINRYAANTQPDIAIITGLAPAHMDKLKSIDLAGKELFAISDHVDPENVYINEDSPMLVDFMRKEFGNKSRFNGFSQKSSLGWSVTGLKSDLGGLKFKLQKEVRSIQVESKLIGKHLVGPLSVVAALSHKLGMQEEAITKAIKNTKAHKARLEPIKLGQATVLNDGYNGNIEGIKAGVGFVAGLKIKGKKIYVTPGLVHQGKDSDLIHKQIAQLIENAFDKIYLIDNPQTKIIHNELKVLGYKKGIEMISDPLGFYNSLESFTSAGDIVLIQNDLPDSLTH